MKYCMHLYLLKNCTQLFLSFVGKLLVKKVCECKEVKLHYQRENFRALVKNLLFENAK